MKSLIKAANDALKSLEGYRRELQGYVGHGGEQQCDAEKALRQALAETEGMCIVPIEPDEACLISMATCSHHGFGLLQPEQQKRLLHEMRKHYDEVVGKGYYSIKNSDRYKAMLSAYNHIVDSNKMVGDVSKEPENIDTSEAYVHKANNYEHAEQSVNPEYETLKQERDKYRKALEDIKLFAIKVEPYQGGLSIKNELDKIVNEAMK